MASDLLCFPSQLASTTPSLTTRLPLSRNSKQRTSLANPNKPWRAVTCAVSTQDTQITENSRRSANYQPNLWDFDFLLQSLENDRKVAD